jgi:glycosyltransferase involved in cell wall biosynthesis
VKSQRRAPKLVSVVVPVRDAAGTLGEQLRALAAQDYAGDWELVVVDNGSTDGSAQVARRELARLPHARLLHEAANGRGNGAALARNAGAAAARGDLLAFCDADDVVSPGWLRALVAAAPRGDVVAGRLEDETLNPPVVRAWQDTPSFERRDPLRSFLPSASTSNCAVWRDVFAAVGGFEPRHHAAEDKDFAWRAQLAGHRVERAPDAVVAYRYRDGLRATARQHFDYGRASPRLFRRFAAAGMGRSSVVDALRGWAWTVLTLPALAWSRRHRGRWVRRTAWRTGHVVGSLRHRRVFL